MFTLRKDLLTKFRVACFAGGNFILGGLVLDEDKYVDFGLKLTAGCYDTYHSTITGIGPESFSWLPSTCNSTNSSAIQSRDTRANATIQAHAQVNAIREARSPQTSPYRNYVTATSPASPLETNMRAALSQDSVTCPVVPKSQSAFYAKSGFYLNDPSYDLRPEVIESYYYAYRVTGDPKYQEWAWEAFKAINASARVGAGFTQLTNVNVAAGGGPLNDMQESFLFAEVMKYSYMIFAKDGPWQVNYGGEGDAEQFVFNTEAHPFRVAQPGGYAEKKKRFV
jgi:mannosyl-oligosaccharide alpha-1,2-mannosidase